MPLSNQELFRSIQTWATSNYPGLVAKMKLIVELHDGGKTMLLVPAQAVQQPPEDGWVPNEKQAAILEALEGKRLKTKALEEASGYPSSELFRPKGGLKELQERGLVGHDRGGFFSVDAPPD